MVSVSWLEKLKSAKKTALVQDDRKWKRKTSLAGDGQWDYEVGEPGSAGSNLMDEIRESNTNYSKPEGVLLFEKQLKQHLTTVKSIDESQGDCKTS